MAAPGTGCPAWVRPRLLPAAPHPTRETPLALGDTCLQALLPPTLTLFPGPPSPAQAFCAQGLDRARRRRGRSLPEPWVQPVWSPPRRPLPPQPSPALHTPGGWRPEGPAPGQSRVGQHLGPGGGGVAGSLPSLQAGNQGCPDGLHGGCLQTTNRQVPKSCHEPRANILEVRTMARSPD